MLDIIFHHVVPIFSSLWTWVWCTLVAVIFLQFLVIFTRRSSNAPWSTNRESPSFTYASTLDADPYHRDDSLGARLYDIVESASDALRTLFGRSSNHDVLLTPIDEHLGAPWAKQYVRQTNPHRSLSPLCDTLNYRLNQFVAITLTLIAESRTAGEHFVVWALGVVARFIYVVPVRSSSPRARRRHVTFDVDEKTSSSLNRFYERQRTSSPQSISPSTGESLQPHQQSGRVDERTRLFCFFYLLAIIYLVLAESPFSQIVACVAFCVTLQSLDMWSTSLPPTADVTTVPHRNSVISRSPHRPVTAGRPLLVNCDGDEPYDDGALDVAIRFLVVRLSGNEIARLFCSVLTGAVTLLNVGNYPQTVFVILSWFAMFETTECLLVLGFFKSLLFSLLRGLIVKYECQSCRMKFRRSRYSARNAMSHIYTD